MSCERDLLDVLTVLTIPAIAVLALVIGYGQFALNRNRLKLELFDRRYSVFEATKKFLYSILRDFEVLDEERNLFLENTKGAIFLFDREICDYLDDFHLKSLELRKANKANDQTLKTEMEVWFSKQADDLEGRFSSKMGIEV